MSKINILLICLIVLAGAGCEQIPESATDVPKSSVTDVLENFHVVEPGFWRSGQPNLKSILRLTGYDLKTIVNLHSDSLNAIREKKIADSLEIDYYYYPLDPRERPSHARLRDILQLVHAPENRPVLVHCDQGRDLTGLIAGAYRMQFSDITFEDVRQEMLLYGHNEKVYPFISITVEKWRDYMKSGPPAKIAPDTAKPVETTTPDSLAR